MVKENIQRMENKRSGKERKKIKQKSGRYWIQENRDEKTGTKEEIFASKHNNKATEL